MNGPFTYARGRVESSMDNPASILSQLPLNRGHFKTAACERTDFCSTCKSSRFSSQFGYGSGCPSRPSAKSGPWPFCHDPLERRASGAGQL